MKGIILGFTLFVLVGCNSKAQNTTDLNQAGNEQEQNNVQLTGAQLVLELEKLNFFNLTEKEDLKATKAEFEKSYIELNYFGGLMKGESMLFTDNRFYFIDTETLFEVGGLKEYLETVKKTFDKLNLKLIISEEFSHQTEKHWTHKIKLNGKEYIAYDNDFGEYDWGISFVNFIEMLNDQLKLQHSKEQFYPISSGNDGRMVLLTKEQFEFVQANYPNDKEQPKEISVLKKGYGL
ncbi:hypothetical protein [Flavobacterium sp.]|uniref:hypothetical protein n=1 Tax=Flavobacterium sp. TaxID=239 RepID=UPI0025C4EB3F|nr:hypothetical protein [Flavobacterium sp.]MBA4153949.1 hypothetical protein [Flavobacterium sp.]